jgi:hypothetical protein
MPAFDDLYDVTRKFVPVMFVAVWIDVLCTNCPLMKNAGSRFGIADPASCTLRPLSTPPVPPLVPPAVPPDPSCVLANTPIDAEDGPCEMVFDTFRSNAPAFARIRFASASFGLYRDDSRSRLFSSASAIASRSDR